MKFFEDARKCYGGTIANVIMITCLLALSGCLWDDTSELPTAESAEYLPLDDSQYPYAGVPRLVIETENYGQIRDVITEHKSKLQVYGKSGPEGNVLKLTVRGRGNSSAKMPKYGLKLEFDEKQSMFGMPKNRDWNLVANYGEKTHVRNHMAFRLSQWLGASYTPGDQYVELYLNRKYMGLYLFTESIKVGKNRVNIPKNEYSFLFEKEENKKLDSPYVTTYREHSFHVKSPKNPKPETLKLLQNHLDDFENYLIRGDFYNRDNIETWIDMDSYLLQYWLQEYSKNEDGSFLRSIFMTWEKDKPIYFGPIWDMDLSFGNESYEENQSPAGWYIRQGQWHRHLFRNREFRNQANDYWKQNRQKFRNLIDSIPLYVKEIEPALKNEYKRWPVLKNTENWALKKPYDSYEEAVEDMKDWMEKRFQWIESNI